jgi:hypothetical protein
MDKLPTFDEMSILPIQLEDLEGAQSLFCFDVGLNPSISIMQWFI